MRNCQYYFLAVALILFSSLAFSSEEIQALFNKKSKKIFVGGAGVVVKNLEDDTQGSKHQRFIIELENKMTLLIVHNIDLAPRIRDLKLGDSIEFFGEYIWNKQGGLIHWTHHDPDGEINGGWIRHKDTTYR